MAQVFPLNVDDLTQDGQPTLAGMLAALPEPWTLLRDRRIGSDAAEPVQIVLVHPEIGIALVDDAPRDPAPEAAALGTYLEGARFNAYFPGNLPIVALSVAAEDFAAVGERLAAAFDAAPRLSIADGDWADAVIELLLVPDDLAMAPVGDAPATAPSEPAIAYAPSDWARGSPEAPPERRMGPALDPGEIPLPLMVDWPFANTYRPRRRWGTIAAAVAGMVLLAGAGVAAWQLGGDGILPGADTTQRAQVEIPLPPPQPPANRAAETARALQNPPPVPAAPPIVLAQKPTASPPPAPPVPTRVEPLPETAANIPPPATSTPAAPAAAPPVTAAVPPSPPSPPQSQTATAPAPTPPAAPVPAQTQTAPPPGPQPSSQAAAEPSAAKPPPRAAAAAAAKPKPPPSRVAKAEPPAPKAPAPLERPRAQQGGGGPPIDAQDLPPLDDLPAAKAPPPVETAAPSSAPPVAAPSTALGPPVPLRALPASGTTAADPNPRECRPYTSNTTLTGRGAAVQGIACRGPDGQWRLVSEVPVR